ncbi:MAG: hypothetical protein JW757_02520 [Anaerolineales bacterium]|nr:hypothetical protein [Anaerolineales bacterium]
MNSVPAGSDLILVAFIPSPQDLEIARLLGWYRIPTLKAPKVIAVDWLAFYQPASFGKDRQWKIEFAAPVRGHELALRAELFKDQQDHPRARDEYFKIQLGPLIRLPRPIPAGTWKRLTFLYTTGERLLDAETITDLSVYDEERNMLWKSLRERALATQQYQVHDLPELPLGSDLLALFGLLGGSNDE